MNKESQKRQLLNYIKSQRIMSLATQGEELAVCTVYYAVDDNWNFYFVSEESVLHSQNIFKNPNVACNIVDSSQSVANLKIGVQIQGIVSKLSDTESIKAGLKYWKQMNTGVENIINIKNIENKVISSRVWQIQPIRIKFFNEELYGDEESEIFEF